MYTHDEISDNAIDQLYLHALQEDGIATEVVSSMLAPHFRLQTRFTFSGPRGPVVLDHAPYVQIGGLVEIEGYGPSLTADYPQSLSCTGEEGWLYEFDRVDGQYLPTYRWTAEPPRSLVRSAARQYPRENQGR